MNECSVGLFLLEFKTKDDTICKVLAKTIEVIEETIRMRQKTLKEISHLTISPGESLDNEKEEPE